MFGRSGNNAAVAGASVGGGENAGYYGGRATGPPAVETGPRARSDITDYRGVNLVSSGAGGLPSGYQTQQPQQQSGQPHLYQQDPQQVIWILCYMICKISVIFLGSISPRLHLPMFVEDAEPESRYCEEKCNYIVIMILLRRDSPNWKRVGQDFVNFSVAKAYLFPMGNRLLFISLCHYNGGYYRL